MASRGPPLLAPFTGFTDSRPVDDFLYIFSVNTFGLDDAVKHAELLRCLSAEVALGLKQDGFDLLTENFAAVQAKIKSKFAKPGMSVTEARQALQALRIKDRQPLMDFAQELLRIATLAQEATDARLCTILYDKFDYELKMAVGRPPVDKTFSEFLQLVADRYDIHMTYGPRASTATMAVGSSTSPPAKYPVPRHGRNREQASAKDRPARSRSTGRQARAPAQPKFTGTCWYCNKKNHRQLECRSRIKANAPLVEAPPTNVVSSGPTITVTADVQGKPLDLLVDTGSALSLVKASELPQDADIKPRTLKLPTANGSNLNVTGSVMASLPQGQLELLVSPDLLPTGILGLVDMGRLNLTIDCAMRQLVSLPQVNSLPSGLQQLLSQFKSVFTTEDRKHTLANAQPLTLELKRDARPPFHDRGGPVFTQEEQVFARGQVQVWLREGIIVPSSSQSRTYLLVARNGRKLRLCPAFLALNSATVFKPQPMPTQEVIRSKVGLAKVFSVLDLSSAFTSVPLHPESQPLTAFEFEGSVYQFTRVQWGLINAATTFQAYIENVLQGLNGAIVYIDDILLFSDTEVAMQELLSKVFQRLQEANLLVNSDKCKFLQKEVPYLGHILGPGYIRADPERTTAIAAWTFPATRSELKSFLGAAGFISPFVEDYGLIKGLLHPLLSSKKPYLPTEQHRKAFEELKTAIRSATELAQPIPGLPLFLRTDASKVGLGAFLYQDNNGEKRPLFYLSRVLRGAEVRYPAQKLELLAIKWALAVLRRWVLSAPAITIITDHASLVSVTAQAQANATLQRWAAQINEYAPRFEYRPGSGNHLADFLSRHPALREPLPDEMDDAQNEDEAVKEFNARVHTATPTSAVLAPPASEAPWTDVKALRAMQERDDFAKAVLLTLYGQKKAANIPRGMHFLVDPATKVLLAEPFPGRRVIVAPQAIVPDILQRLHDMRGHFRRSKTLSSVKAEFFWLNMRQDVEEYLSNCITCAARGPHVPQPAPEGSLRADTVNELVSTDIVGPFMLTERGNAYIVTFTCNFSKFNVSVAIPDTTAQTIIRAFSDRWCAVFGPPRRLLSDNGPQYTSHAFEEFCKKKNIKHVRTTPYNPSGNGVAERINRTLMSTLSKTALDPRLWDLHLHEVVYAHNASVSATTNETPHLLMLGRAPNPLVDIPDLNIEDAEDAVKRVQEINAKEKERLASQTTAVPFKPGDVVLLHNPVVPGGAGGKRLHLPYNRSKLVKKVILPNTLILTDMEGNNPIKTNCSRVRPAPRALQPPPKPAPQNNPPKQPNTKPSDPAQAHTPAAGDAVVKTSRSGRIVKPSVRFK
jgi:transposase InsO family protein